MILIHETMNQLSLMNNSSIKIKLEKKMIKIENEREFLPIVRDPLGNFEKFEKLFLPVFRKFHESQLNEDKYAGWSFSMFFFKKNNKEYLDIMNTMDMKRHRINGEWIFAPSLKDKDDSIWKINDIVVMIHLESWLWFG